MVLDLVLEHRLEEWAVEEYNKNMSMLFDSIEKNKSNIKLQLVMALELELD
jgi:beta-mannanase